MRIAFINTPGGQNLDPFRMTPVGSFLLLTILKRRFGETVQLSYIDLRGKKLPDAYENIPENDIYLHFCTTPEWGAIVGLVNTLRFCYPKALHFGGGPHCGIFPKEAEAVFDAVCIGEGEGVICDMVQDAMRGVLAKTYQQKKPTDISTNPIPDRSYLPENRIAISGFLSRDRRATKTATVLFSRGCPYSCHFCSNQYHGQTQHRRPDQIIEEIEYLQDAYKIGGIRLIDDNGIPQNERVSRSQIPAIGRTGILWRAQGRANGIPLEIPRLSADNGCVEITVAIESVWQPSLDAMNKRIDIEAAMPYMRAIKDSGIDLKLMMILGLPLEPADIAKRFIDFIERVQPSGVILASLCPIPGSQLWKTPERFGMSIRRDVPFENYAFAWGRFDEAEKTPHFFDYAVGHGLPWEARKEAHETVQEYLRRHELNY